MKRLLIAIVLVAAWSGGAAAERRVALVLGVDAYRSVRPLENAVNDARTVEETLTGLGFEVFSEANRDLRRMRRAVEDFRLDAEGADVALVFFAGHGVEIAGDNRLLPIDADASSLEALRASTLPLEEVRDVVAAVAKVGLIVLDACRNDPFGTIAADGRAAVSLKAEVAVAANGGLGRVGRANNILFAFSAAPGETAADGEGTNSPFTAALTRLLPTDGLEIRSVLTLVQQEVYDLSGGRQLPYVESGLPAMFFAAATGELPERERLLLAMADVTPSHRDEVERVAAENGMPLAPLYGAFLSAGLARAAPEERAARLAEAAEAFVKVRDEMLNLASADPEVTRLRGEAETQLSLGAFATAREKLAEAASLDGASRRSLKSNFVERTLSEAGSRFLSGGAARADLRYALAIADYEQAAAIFTEVDSEPLPKADRVRQFQTFEALTEVATATGDTVRARRWTDEWIKVAAREAEREPDVGLWKRSQLLAHSSLGGLERNSGNLAAALTAYEAGLALARLKLRSDPGDAEALHDGAASMIEIGDLLVRTGDVGRALHVLRVAHSAFARLAADNPGDALRQGALASSHLRLGEVHRIQGDVAAALGELERSLAIRLRLVDADPGNPDLQLGLAIVHHAIGDARAVTGGLSEALEAYRAGARIREGLAKSVPENVVWQHALSSSRLKIGDALMSQGEIGAALAEYTMSLEIRERLASIDPDSVGWQADLAASHDRIGGALDNAGDAKGALASFRTSLAIFERLSERSPDDARRMVDLADAHGRIGDLYKSEGALDKAHASYAAAMETRRRLVTADPSNTSWLRRLSVSHRMLGDLHLMRNDPTAALEEYRAGHRIAERLAGADPGNRQWQRDLSVSHNLVGDALVTSGDDEGAVVSFKASMAIVERLAAGDPGNGELQWDLFSSYWRVADNSPAKAEYFARALDVLETLHAQGRLAKSRVEWIDTTRRALNAAGGPRLAEE